MCSRVQNNAGTSFVEWGLYGVIYNVINKPRKRPDPVPHMLETTLDVCMSHVSSSPEKDRFVTGQEVVGFAAESASTYVKIDPHPPLSEHNKSHTNITSFINKNNVNKFQKTRVW